jgi:hypothetical protein
VPPGNRNTKDMRAAVMRRLSPDHLGLPKGQKVNQARGTRGLDDLRTIRGTVEQTRALRAARRRPQEDEPGWNWRTQGNKQRGVRGRYGEGIQSANGTIRT